MVIYGHDLGAKHALFDWLRAIGLVPREWNDLISGTGSASPYIGQVLDRALRDVQAVVALFTPDEHVTPALPTSCGTPRLQARPNVLIEAGMALVTHPTRTVIVMVGEQELPSDLAGRHYVRLSHTDSAPLRDLASRLGDAGCDTNLTGTDWLNPDRFPDRALADSKLANVTSQAEGDSGPDLSSTAAYPVPLTTSRWRNLNNGGGYQALMETGRHSISHPAYRADNEAPYMQVAVLIACEPLGSAPSTSQIRARFLAFLGDGLSGLLSGTTRIRDSDTWMTWGDSPRHTFSAILASPDQQEPPTAWARLNLPGTQHSYSQAPACAHLILHVRPTSPAGDPAAPVPLAAWHRRLTQILTLPCTLADFLTSELNLIPSGDPAAQIGVCLNAPHSLTQLVDLQELEAVPGTTVNSWYRG